MNELRPEWIQTASLYPIKTLPERTRNSRPMVITRYWPRGLKRVHGVCTLTFMPFMAPSAGLLLGYKDGTITWETFATRYRDEVQPHLTTWRKGIRDYICVMSVLNGDEFAITLLCHEHDAPEDSIRCHRRLLRDLLLETTGGGDA